MTKETEVIACVEHILRKYRTYYTKQKGVGVVDFIVCYRGMFLGVECKAGFNKPTALQEREMAAIHKAGGSAMIVREDTIELLEQWFNERSQWK
jgi:hypothetical protein